MSLSARAIEALRRKAQRQYDQACMRLARMDQAIANASQTKETLGQFVLERASQRRAQTGEKTGADALRTNSNFSNKLRHAVQSQENTLNELVQTRKTGLAAVVEIEKKLKILESLKDKVRRSEIQIELLGEQRESDEFAARRSRTGSVMTENSGDYS